MKITIRITLLLSLFLLTLNAGDKFPKDYYKMSISKKKEFFFNYFEEKIARENKLILEERNFIKSLNKNKNLDKNSNEYQKLKNIQKKYKIQKLYDYSKYLTKIDIIPPSMAIAQAATESGWGKSRFFKKANNIFGHWTYNPKIGMKPLRREEGKKHFIRIFPSLQASISAYMLNLNRNSTYKEFRIKRKKMRASNKLINGMKLSSTMEKYSGIGHDYIDILESIIRKNKLVVLDKNFYKKINKKYKPAQVLVK